MAAIDPTSRRDERPDSLGTDTDGVKEVTGRSCTPLRGGSKEGEEALPREFTKWDRLCRILSVLLSLVALIYLVVEHGHGAFGLPLFYDYMALAALPLWLFVDRYIKHANLVHEAKLEDPSEVMALFVEAETVEPRLSPSDENHGSRERPLNYERRRCDLVKEVARLRRLGEGGWTYYQLLNLNQMLVDFLKLEDLKERAKSSLDDLEEYAIDSAVSYDLRKYDRWKERINNAIEQVEDSGHIEGRRTDDTKTYHDEERKDEEAEALRARLRTLQEHVASYEAAWAEGSVIVRSLIISCAVAMPILFGLGLMPSLHPGSDGILHIVNWAFLGIAGALTGVLLSLRKSNVAEVGVTAGKREVWRTVIGAVLGLVAGIVTYSMVTGNLLLAGLIVPDTHSAEPRDAALSILWAVGAGFSFERVFERLRGATIVGGLD